MHRHIQAIASFDDYMMDDFLFTHPWQWPLAALECTCLLGSAGTEMGLLVNSSLVASTKCQNILYMPNGSSLTSISSS